MRNLVAQAKRMAARIEDASGLWDLESWLTQRRLEIDRKYDYRYSVLPFVFATLLQQGRITENDLQGLHTEKIELILGIALRL
jgi:Photoprotection regulator fluorescence recovery protein